jgi:hypothetical protein
MVRTMTAAAGGQARLCVGREQRKQRPQPEKQNEQNTKWAPHPNSWHTRNTTTTNRTSNALARHDRALAL